MYTLLLSCLIKLEARRFNCHNLYPSLKRNRCEKEIHVYMYKRVSLLIKKSNENRFCYVINIITFRYTNCIAYKQWKIWEQNQLYVPVLKNIVELNFRKSTSYILVCSCCFLLRCIFPTNLCQCLEKRLFWLPPSVTLDARFLKHKPVYKQ